MLFSYEEPRADFYGEIGSNPITGHPEPVYPKWKRVIKFYCVSVPILIFFLTVAFFAMLAYFWLEDWFKLNAPQDMGILTTINNLVPTIVYAVVIAVLNVIYRSVAAKLNKYGNDHYEITLV